MYKKTYQPSTTLMSSPVGHEIEAVLCSHTIDCSSYADANFTPPFKTSASEAANYAAFVNFEFVFCFVIIVILLEFQFQRKACDILYIYNRRCVSSFCCFLSDNKCTLCLAFVLLRVCLRTTRINCLSQNVSVDTLRKVKHESRVLRQSVARKADTMSLGFYY